MHIIVIFLVMQDRLIDNISESVQGVFSLKRTSSKNIYLSINYPVGSENFRWHINRGRDKILEGEFVGSRQGFARISRK